MGLVAVQLIIGVGLVRLVDEIKLNKLTNNFNDAFQ